MCVYDINGFTCHIQNLCQLYHITIMKFLGFILYTCAVLFCGCSIRYNFNHLIFFYIISRIILKLSQENCSFVSCLGRAGISHTPCKTATQRECQIYRGEVMLIVLYPWTCVHCTCIPSSYCSLRVLICSWTCKQTLCNFAV